MNSEEKNLRERVQHHQNQMSLDRERAKPSPVQRMIEGMPDTVDKYDFWCEECQIDFTSPAYKVSYRVFGEPIASYRSQCPKCDEDCIRLISHRDNDVYYALSDKVRIQRKQYRADILQAEDYGFRSRYGEPFVEHIKRIQEAEEKIIQEERMKGYSGFSLEAKEKLAKLNNAYEA